MPRTYRQPFSESDARAAIARATCWADALRLLGYSVKGSNYRTLRRWAERWALGTDHFDPNAGRTRAARTREAPLESLLVENSTYHRGSLKRRLLSAGLLAPRCEMCGQDEHWHGRRMSLVLDHINGVSNDNRLENLRMVCPNCAATLDTHCGRNLPRERLCPSCGAAFAPRDLHHRYCSQSCVGAANAAELLGVPRVGARKVPRPSYGQLMSDIQSMSLVAIGRKYGVSDNAVRKWMRWYQNERARRGTANPPEPA